MIKTLLLFLMATLILLAACEPDSIELRKDKVKEQPVSNDTITHVDSAYYMLTSPIHDITLENRTWQFMGYAHTDSIKLNLPDDAAMYNIELNDSTLTGSTPTGNITAKYKLYFDKRLRMDLVGGAEINETPYINALQALKQARKYEVSNEALKIFYSDKEYLLFVEKNEIYPKEIKGISFFHYMPFHLNVGDKLIFNTKSKLLEYCKDVPPYTPYQWAMSSCYSFKLDSIDFAKSSVVVGCCSTDRGHVGNNQKIIQLGENTYMYLANLDVAYNDNGIRKLYYGIVLDNRKIMDNATIIHNINIDHRYCK